MPEIPPVIKNFIGTIPPAERGDFLNWLKSQPSPAPVAGALATEITQSTTAATGDTAGTPDIKDVDKEVQQALEQRQAEAIPHVQELFGRLRQAYREKPMETPGEIDLHTRNLQLDISHVLNLGEEEGIEAIIKEEARGVMFEQSKGDIILGAILKSEQPSSPQTLFPQSERLQLAYARLVPAYKGYLVSGHFDDSRYNDSRNAFLVALDEATGIDRSEISNLYGNLSEIRVSLRHLLRNIIEEGIPDGQIPGLSQAFSRKVGNEIAYLKALNNQRIGRLELLIGAAQRAGIRLDIHMLEELKRAGMDIGEAAEPEVRK